MNMKDTIETNIPSLQRAEDVRKRFIAPKEKRRHKFQWQAFIWMLPAFAFLFVFSYFPPIKACIDSFIYEGSFSWGNYKELFSDSVFWVCVKNTFIFTIVGLLCGNLMTIILAELLYNFRNKKASGFFRILFILPILVPGVVLILIWQFVIFGSDGLVSQIIRACGGVPPTEYYTNTTDAVVAKLAIIMTNFPWVAGTSFLIYLAGLQNISPSIIEASKLDNCNTFKRVFRIDIPLLFPQIKYFLIMGIIGGIQNFNLQLIVANKWLYHNTDVLGLYLYNYAFGQGGIPGNVARPEYACAVGMFIFAITLVLTIISNVVTKNDK